MGIPHNKYNENEYFLSLWGKVSEYTMTSPERGCALYDSVNYILDNKIPGAFVECGVWRGGSSMLMALTLLGRNNGSRNLFLFDTFEGMSPPSKADVDLQGNKAEELLLSEDKSSLMWAIADKNQVRQNMEKTAYDQKRIRYIEGDVRDTLSTVQTGQIALLRLDTDFYESTKHELETLYPRVAQGGIIILDDYGHWKGCQKAVDEFFSTSPLVHNKPLFNKIDYTGRLLVKIDKADNPDIERYDYHPPGWTDINLLEKLDGPTVIDPHSVSWPYLRRSVPHIWRTESSFKGAVKIGILSYEEATILYNLALQFKGKRALEIGCHMGWSSAHILAAGLSLDIVDPRLGDPEHKQSIDERLRKLGLANKATPWPGFSPDIIPAISSASKSRWSFVFIDGNHDGDAPAQDAQAVSEHCENNAMIVFHDMVSPHVTEGIKVLKERGWNTAILNTMQIMGIAWRGNVKIPAYQPDPNTPKAEFIPHLREFKKLN